MNKPESHLMLKKIGAYALFILIALYVLIPLYALFLATFKDGTDMIQHGLNLEVNLPEMHLKNYAMLYGIDDYTGNIDPFYQCMCGIWICSI